MRWKKAAALTLAGVLSLGTVCTSFAMEKPADMDDATWARLQDNRLEYDEIENLVTYYCPTYRTVVDQIDLNVAPVETAVNDLKEEIKEIRQDARYAKDENDLITYNINMAMAKAYEKQALKPLETALNKANYSTKNVKDPVRRNLVSAVQKIMIGYHQALASKELTDTSVELMEALYQSTLSQKNIGMATDTDVQSAEKSVLSAKSQQQSLYKTLDSVYQNLCIMTGWSYDSAPEIGEIPAPDFAVIDAMNPEQDITKAISYNPDIIELRGTSGKGTANHSQKFRSLDEAEAKLKTKLESLYQTVLESRTSYEAASNAYESAKLTMNGNDLRYQMGMLGKLEYLQAKMGYLQNKMTYDMAVLSLKQAMEDYQWALYGVVELD